MEAHIILLGLTGIATHLYTDSTYLNANQVRGTAEKNFVTDNPVDLTCINTIAIDWENVGFDGEKQSKLSCCVSIFQSLVDMIIMI